MKKLLVASVFASAPLGANAADLYGDYSYIQESVPSAWSVVGHLELALGWNNIELEDGGDTFENDFGLFEGYGRANIPFAGNWNLELETGGSSIFDDGFSESHIGVFGHLWGGWHGVRAGAFGGFDFVTGGQIGTAGLEGEVDVGNVTLGAQGSYNQLIDCGSCEYWKATGWADFYVTANTRLGIEGTYAYVPDVGSGSSHDIWSVFGTAEQRFAGTALSLFVRGGYESGLDRIEAITVSGGLRVFMDGGLTLQEHDHQVPFSFKHPQTIIILSSD
jgi:hypothetical protein